ncbi:MAG: flagellar protein FlaG [Clostridiales bacterium]|nr:flagellar protein FlaG [Clostridiales bacterium]
MEVAGISQGRQMPLDSNTDTSKIVQPLNSLKNQIAKSNQDFKNAKDAVDQANKMMDESRTHLKFEIHGKFKDIVVKVLDDNTNQVLKEVPPTQILDMVEKFCEMAGFFVDEKA